MAAININSAQPRAFENGGVMIINDGTDDCTVLAIEKGTLELEDGGVTRKAWTDRGVQKTRILGEDGVSRIRLRAKLASLGETKGLHVLGAAENTSTGEAKEYTVTFKWPSYKGSSTGHTVAYANTYFASRPKIRAGDEFDMIELEMESRTKDGVWGTY